MNINSSNNLILAKLATLFHDPPWKPWGITGASDLGSGKKYWEILGERVPEKLECLGSLISDKRSVGQDGDSLKRGETSTAGEEGDCLLGKPDLKELVKEIKGSSPLASLVGEALIEAGSKLAGVKGGRGAKLTDWLRECADKIGGRSHEVQSLALVRALEMVLAELYTGSKSENERVLKEAVLYLEGVENSLCSSEGGGGQSVVRNADRLASALDRMALFYVENYVKDKYNEKLTHSELVFVNPFNPNYRVPVRSPSSFKEIADEIALFIAVYVALVSILLLSALKRVNNDGSVPILLYHLGYSLLEPTWYLVVGEPPPADTRVPTHTVFDHLSAATAMVNLLVSGNTPSGCIVSLDLASVQSWIKESKRLRDLWAASWIASWLAWASVSPLVWSLGPDIMVQPPTRLHPFYSTELLSKVCGENPERWDAYCDKIASLLGLKHKWPIDPTVPSRVTLILPTGECGNAKDKILEHYENAWRMLLSRLMEGGGQRDSGLQWPGLNRIYEVVNRAINSNSNKDFDFGLMGEIAQKWLDIKEHIGELEPPLPVRISLVNAGEAWSKACEYAAKMLDIRSKIPLEACGESSQLVSGITISVQDIARILFLQVALDMLWDHGRTSFRIRASGRRSGGSYYMLATKLHGTGAIGNCHVCGYGAAVVDGRVLSQLARKMNHEDRRVLVAASRQLQGERLCPYCLVKRVLRDILASDASIVGLRMPRKVQERIGRATVDLYTSRSRLTRKKIAELVVKELFVDRNTVDLLRVLGALLTPGFRFLNEYNDILYERLNQILGSNNVNNKYLDDILQHIEPLVSEAIHNLAFPREIMELDSNFTVIAEKLRRIALDKTIAGIRRKYAIVRADGDFIGSAVLRGRLNIDPGNYAKLVFNLKVEKKQKEGEGSEVEREAIREAMRKASMLFQWIVARYSMVSGEETHYRKNCGGEKCLTRSIIVTPSYMYTVSRALAAQSVIDRMLAEAFGGMLIYSGGDDLLAVAPPAEIDPSAGDDVRVFYAALHLAEASRRAYWGEGLPPTTRAYLESKGEVALAGSVGYRRGFNQLPVNRIVVPALKAYGRTTVVYYTDSKRPLWLALTVTGELEESKDGSRTSKLENSGVQDILKDLLIVGSDSTWAAILPFSRPGGDGRRNEVVGTAESIQLLLDMINMKKLSGSILYDLENYSTEYAKLLVEYKSPAAAGRLLEKLVERNTLGSGWLRDEYMRLVLRIIGEAYGSLAPRLVTSIQGFEELGLARGIWLPSTLLATLVSPYIRLECEKREGRERVLLIPPILALLEAVRITRSAV